MKKNTNVILTGFLYWISQSRWLIFSILIGSVLFFLPTPEGLTQNGYRTIIIAVTALILIISEPIPLPGVALLIIILQVYFGLGDANDIASAFMNDAVFFIMGSLMLAVAFIQLGWDARIALGIIMLTGNKTHRIAFGLASLSAILSSFIGEHTVAAMLLPIGMSLIRYTNMDMKKVVNLSALLLFSIAYGSLIGSIGTPSGGGRNAIMLTYWKDFGLPSISYMQWIIYVYPLVLIQLPIVSWLLWRNFSPEYGILDSGVRKLKIHVARAGKVSPRELLGAFLFLLVFLGWVFFSESVGLGIIALTGVLLYLVTGLVKWEEIMKRVNWGVVILFGSTISLGTQIKNTGAAVWLADQLMNIMGESLNSLSIITDSTVVVITTIFANVLSSSAAVAVLAPITLNMPGDGLHLGLLTAISSAFGYFTVVAAPACTIIYASGLIKAKDFLKVGWKMGIISMSLTILYANTYWTFLN